LVYETLHESTRPARTSARWCSTSCKAWAAIQ